VIRLQAFHAAHPADERLGRYAELLHGQAVLAEGGTLADPAAFSRRLAELLTEAAGGGA
jgi:HSP90 family molecular chaperone